MAFLFDRQIMYRFFKVNHDIFFAPSAAGGRYRILHFGRAARRIVSGCQYTAHATIHSLSYIMDGFAYAGTWPVLNTSVRQQARTPSDRAPTVWLGNRPLSLAFTLLYGTGGQMLSRDY